MRKITALLLMLALLLGGCVSESAEETQPTVPVEIVTEPASEPETTTESTRPTRPQAEPTEETTAAAEEPADTDFVRVADYISNVRVALAYATEENFTGVRIYNFTDAYLRYGTLRKLRDAAIRLEVMGYGIVIWDAYRPVYAQERLWMVYPDPAYVSPPGSGTQSHCRGCAVDITLYDLKTGELLEMPTGFDDFSPLADRNYSDVSRVAANNAAMLEAVMSQFGFRPYRSEWWHFTDIDSYDIEYVFDPAQMN